MKKQILSEEFKRMQKLAGIINESQSSVNEAKIRNQYVIEDPEVDDYVVYMIDKSKALEYLKQFNNEDIDAEQFIEDEEGWGEFEQYLEDMERMTDKQLERAMREEMSYYFFSEPDEI